MVQTAEEVEEEERIHAAEWQREQSRKDWDNYIEPHPEELKLYEKSGKY